MPLPSTVASAGALLAHVTTRAISALPIESLGVAVNCTVCPSGTLAVAGVTATDATGANRPSSCRRSHGAEQHDIPEQGQAARQLVLERHESLPFICSRPGPAVGANLEARIVPREAGVDGTLVRVVPHREHREGDRVGAVAESAGVEGRERPVAASIPDRIPVIFLLEVGVPKNLRAGRVVYAHMDLDVRGIHEVDIVLDAVPHPVRELPCRTDVADRIDERATVHADDEPPAGTAAVLPHVGQIRVGLVVGNDDVVAGGRSVIVPHVVANVVIRRGRHEIVLPNERGEELSALHDPQGVVTAGTTGYHAHNLPATPISLPRPAAAIPQRTHGIVSKGRAPIALEHHAAGERRRYTERAGTALALARGGDRRRAQRQSPSPRLVHCSTR